MFPDISRLNIYIHEVQKQKHTNSHVRTTERGLTTLIFVEKYRKVRPLDHSSIQGIIRG